MVAFEHSIGDLPDDGDGRVSLDMPGLAVLVSLDLFGEMRPTTLAELLGGTSSMATKVVGRMERQRCVERRHGAVEDDRRAVTVQVTDRGRAVIAACEAILAALSVDFLASMAAVDMEAAAHAPSAPATHEVPGLAAPVTAPGLAEFLRFIVEIDKPLLATVGRLEVLHPSDPRGLLVLAELDRRGPQHIGALPGVVGRSRSTTHRLCGELEAVGLVHRIHDPDGDRRRVALEITEVGRAILRGAVAAITAHLGDLRPSMVALSRALSGERTGLGAPAA
jgi:DNA-binding MarR family transcriptional regulator